jgi:hypothetical protein
VRSRLRARVRDGGLTQRGSGLATVQTDVGQVDNLALADPEAPRFVWWDKKLRPTPDGLASLPTFTLLSPLGKVGGHSPVVLPHSRRSHLCVM